MCIRSSEYALSGQFIFKCLVGLILKCTFVFLGHSTNYVVAVYLPNYLSSNFA